MSYYHEQSWSRHSQIADHRFLILFMFVQDPDSLKRWAFYSVEDWVLLTVEKLLIKKRGSGPGGNLAFQLGMGKAWPKNYPSRLANEVGVIIGPPVPLLPQPCPGAVAYPPCAALSGACWWLGISQESVTSLFSFLFLNMLSLIPWIALIVCASVLSLKLPCCYLSVLSHFPHSCVRFIASTKSVESYNLPALGLFRLSFESVLFFFFSFF